MLFVQACYCFECFLYTKTSNFCQYDMNFYFCAQVPIFFYFNLGGGWSTVALADLLPGDDDAGFDQPVAQATVMETVHD